MSAPHDTEPMTPPTTDRALDRTVLLGFVGAVLMALFAVGAGGLLVRDPLVGSGPLSWIRYGHGRDLATALVYLGFGLLVLAWIRLGRDVLAGRATSRKVIVASVAWSLPMLVSPPLFTRDVYSYLAQGALAVHGFDPYQNGPVLLGPGSPADNVHYVWQTTPAPYGPLFLLIAQGVYALTREHTILGVILMRITLLPGLALLVYALPRLAQRLGGSAPIALWLVVASPMTVVHLIGGPHNDLLMIGLLALGVLLVLSERHAAGIAVVSVAMAVKATAGIALPFLVWVWAARLPGPPWKRFVRAAGSGVAVFALTFGAATLVSGVGLGWLSAISAPTLIVNWMSLPTGLGQIVYHTANLFADPDRMAVVSAFRTAGSVVLGILVIVQWWRSRHGGPDAVRRLAIVLVGVAVLSPTTLPWYLTWALVVGAGLVWSRRGLAIVAGLSSWLVLSAYPTGESPLNSWPYVLTTMALSALAGVSLLRVDPLRLRGAPQPEPDRPEPDRPEPSRPDTDRADA